MDDRVIHISQSEAANDFTSLLARVRAGAEVIIERNDLPVAVLRAPTPFRRIFSECLALLPETSTATIDPDFAEDVERAIEGHEENHSFTSWSKRCRFTQ